MRSIASIACLGVVLAVTGTVQAQLAEGIDGILSPTSAGLQTCLAVEISLPEGQQLSGLRWYNNDGTTPFTKIAIVERAGEGPPPLTSDSAEYPAVIGASNAWSEVGFEGGISSASATLYAVFVFPAGSARTGVGAGAGPGVGYRFDILGSPAYLSADGQEWVRLHPAFGLAVEPLFQDFSAGATFLASLPATGAALVVEPAAEGSQHLTALLPVRPNPSNPAATVAFTLSEPGPVQIAIYNLRGALVQRLVSGEYPAGEHEVTWTGTDERGGPVASGVYIARMDAAGEVFRQHLALVR